MDAVTYAVAKNAAKKYTDDVVSALEEGLNYKGSVANQQALPATGNEKGDAYNCSDGTGLFVWDGSAWTSASKAGPQGPTGPQGPKGEDGNVSDVTVNGTSVLDGGVAKLAVVDNTTSTSTSAPLSAHMGKELQDEINNLKNIGRFLAIWNSATGLPLTNPTTMPYTYKTGDYYRVGVVAEGSANNYKPNGASYSGTASTTVETEDVEVGWVYYYDGSQWLAQSAGGGGTVQDVQVNGTSIVASGTGIANIPIAGANNLGVVRVEYGDRGITNSSGLLGILKARDDELEGKSQIYRPVVPSNLDKAVMEGLGNNSLTWTDAYKSSARNTIGAIALEEYNSSASSYSDGVLYYTVD